MTARRFDMTHRPDESSLARGDLLSDVLHALRLRGAVFFSVHATSPWVAEAPPALEVAPWVMPGADHVIEYHVVTSGSCWGGLIGEPAVALEPGDILIFPQGDGHALASSPGMRGPVDHELHERVERERLPIRIELGGTGRDPVHVVCGFLACDAQPFNPLLASLPRLLHVKRRTDERGAMLDRFVSLALEESTSPRAGGDVVLARLSELMFVEVVRDYLASLDATRSGWLAGLRDEVVGRALGAIHARPAQPWTLETLAREVAVSRSVLAERFQKYVGVPPMQYLAQWRMQLAASMLSGPKTLAEIAGEVGYGSEAALSRAFKKIVGVAPAIWRAKRSEAPRRLPVNS